MEFSEEWPLLVAFSFFVGMFMIVKLTFDRFDPPPPPITKRQLWRTHAARAA